jgi:hypothetical protein
MSQSPNKRLFEGKVETQGEVQTNEVELKRISKRRLKLKNDS